MRKYIIAILLVMVLLIGGIPPGLNTDASAASVSPIDAPPYPYVNYEYSSGVQTGRIRYMSQISGSPYFNNNYWGDWIWKRIPQVYSGPGEECGTCSMSMALSYIGINKTPDAILSANNGVTYWIGWGAEHSGPAIIDGMTQYINGNGKYSPIVIRLPGGGSNGNDHFIVAVGKSGSTLTILDPAIDSIMTATINGSSVTYQSRTYYVSETHQWYNPSAQIYPQGSVMSSGAGRTIPDGDYLIASAADTSYFLDIPGVEYPAAPNTNVNLAVLTKSTPDPFDIWTVTYVGDGGFYSIFQRGTGIALDVESASVQCGANVWVCNSNGTNAQKWSISENANGTYRIQAKCSGFSLDIAGGNISVGTNIQQWTNNDTDAQKWVFIPYSRTVTYDANGGTGAPESQTAASNSAITLSSVRPSRSNSVENYTVTLDANGGSVSTNSLAAAHTTSFSFKNWNTAANGSGTSYSPGAVYSSDSSVTLYAQWDTTTRTDTVVLPTPTREHYTFMGWGLSSTASNGVTGSYTLNGNVTLYALWERIQYTITYDANGGINPPASQKKNEGVPISLSYQRPPDRESERLMCVGWATSRTATEAEFLFGGRFYTDADTTLYAVWKKYYYIYYDANGGSWAPMSGFHYGDLTIHDWPPEYDGYRFMGWSLSESADSIDYQPGDSVHFEQDTTLYAVWQRIYYSDWSESRPAGIDDNLTETKTQYRYSTKETTTDTVSNKPGWTQTGSQQVWGNYGDWSSWSLDAVSKSDSREVETTAMYRYYYFYCPVCGRHEPFQGMSDCGQYSLSSGDSYIGWFATPYNQSNYQGFSYTNAKYYTTSLGDGQTWCFSAGNLSSSAIGTKDSDSDAVVITTGYRYRTRSQSTVYNFERWTDWSEWSDAPIEASDSKRIETRALYRCKIDEDRVLTLPGALTKIESEAFQNIAADAVAIPESVRSIADDAFDARIVIIGKPNSYAQLYAGWNGQIFISRE